MLTYVIDIAKEKNILEFVEQAPSDYRILLNF